MRVILFIFFKCSISCSWRLLNIGKGLAVSSGIGGSGNIGVGLGGRGAGVGAGNGFISASVGVGTFLIMKGFIFGFTGSAFGGSGFGDGSGFSVGSGFGEGNVIIFGFSGRGSNTVGAFFGIVGKRTAFKTGFPAIISATII